MIGDLAVVYFSFGLGVTWNAIFVISKKNGAPDLGNPYFWLFTTITLLAWPFFWSERK